MSIVRNRELSQFGSFLYIDNNNENIGIATETTPSVGIGTLNPISKLHVVGNTNINGNLTVVSGTVEASSYSLNGVPLTNATTESWRNATNGSDIYRLQGNVGIGTSVFTQKLTVIGNVSAGQFISTVTSTSGLPPFTVLSDVQVANLNASLLRGKVPPSGSIVGTTDVQTLINKTLGAPYFVVPTVSPTGIAFSGSTSGTTTLLPSLVASGSLTLPATTDTLVARNTTDTLTNKTISASSNTISGLTNSNLSGSAGITNANLANSTISSVSLGSTLNSLNFGSYLSSSGLYNGSTARTVSVAGTSINTPSTLVARDSSGDFSVSDISCSSVTASFTITASDFTSTSDVNLKDNISTFKNSLEVVNQLRGVDYVWKNTNRPSIGVIAQELENVLPQLVNNGDTKSVNYNGLIGVLIEAVKELSIEVENLKKLI